MNEQRNLLLTIALTAFILLGWQYVFPPHPTPPRQSVETTTAAPSAATASMLPTAPQLPGELSPSVRSADTPRIHLSSDELHGSISLVGGRLDDLTLARYHETPDPTSPDITLLSPANGAGAYDAEFGWVAGAPGTAVPAGTTTWTADTDELAPNKPVTLTWDNGQGLVFTRVIALDDSAMFTVTERVENRGSAPVTLYPYGLLSRWGTPKTLGTYILHEGPLGVLDGTLKEMTYKKLREDDHLFTQKTTGGWLGFTDKYWLTALVPDQAEPIEARMSWHLIDNLDRYQADWLGAAVTIEPGATNSVTSHLFAGAKVLTRLDYYAHNLSIPRFDLAIDFGWFYFLTKPFFYVLRFIHSKVANFGIAIMIFTVVIKGAFFPIANRSYKAMSKMRKLQPEIKALQARFGEDKARLNQEMMALYKREGANPVSGCLPIVIQIPVFFALYKVLYVTIEMRQAPFFGWIKDLSAPDPTTLFNLFGLIPWTPPPMLAIGVWPLIMGITMYLQQKLNPQPTDPIQAKMMSFLPLIFTFMLAKFPAGLVIYWAWSNCLSIAQQWLIMKRQDA